MAVLSVALLSPGSTVVRAQQPPTEPTTTTPATTEEAPKIPNDELDSLVSPIALYPDPLLAQTLAASTYPLEVIQLQQWLTKNPKLTGKALADAVGKQNWDPSIQAMAALPEVMKQLADNIAWTSDLGNAFLAQQSDVMDAVQRMRAKAQGAGNLKTSKEQKVESKQVEGKTVVVIEQADPKVVYVPSYNPTVIFGPPVYPYPPIYYPPYVAGRVLAFGAGVAIGAAWNGGWGWGCGWGHNNVNVNVNNNYINNFNKTNVNQRITNNSNWQHNGQHRGGAPYSNRTTANKYGGNVRGDSPATRQNNMRQRPNEPGGNRQQTSLTDRSAGGNRQQSAPTDRSAGGNRQQSQLKDRSTGSGPTNRTSDRVSGGGDRIANREVSRSPSPKSNSAFGGASGGMNRSSASASHSRGAQSMGGGSRGGGSRGGGRSGGGRRR
ncbi:MAG TPA: DUF3300 domain-containing protein [Chthoniobacterales bacterium]|nr:DUF3300 domain-containing protein [Chthoniobacterales bacterium]